MHASVPQKHSLYPLFTLLSIEPGGNKRKGPYKPELPARKKPRKKTEPLDEETMMALALSSSLLEQQKEQQAESGPSHSSMTPALKWKPNAGTLLPLPPFRTKGSRVIYILYPNLLFVLI